MQTLLHKMLRGYLGFRPFKEMKLMEKDSCQKGQVSCTHITLANVWIIALYQHTSGCIHPNHSISFSTSGTLCSHMLSMPSTTLPEGPDFHNHIGPTSPNAEVQRESTRVWHPRRHGAGERSLQNARQSRSLPEPDCCPICTRSGSCCKRINHPTVLKQDTFSKGG